MSLDHPPRQGFTPINSVRVKNGNRESDRCWPSPFYLVAQGRRK